MFDNHAAWMNAKHASLKVGSAPYTPSRAGQILVRNHAVAINPVDWVVQRTGNLTFPYIKYPWILGADSAGEIAEVGEGVSRFKVGDRVLCHCAAIAKSHNFDAEGAFQHYSIVMQNMAAPIPAWMSFEQAAVLPLAVSTAACGLYQKDHLALAYPSLTPKATGDTVLIWGGSTSVGSNAIQLAVASGYEVVTTASPKNFDYVRKLGASRVFDYASPTAVSDVIKEFRGRSLAGSLAIGAGSVAACVDIVRACKGRKFISIATFPIALDGLPDRPGFRAFVTNLLPQVLGSELPLMLKARMHGIATKGIFGTSLMDNEVGEMLFANFLPVALAKHRYIVAPEPLVAGHGLEQIQGAIELLRRGVSAKKLVVSLGD